MKTFLNLPKFREAKVVIVPVPYESTTSYKKGTVNGPSAILKASNELYLYDHELGIEPYSVGITTLDPVKSLSKLEKLKKDKFVIALGGEHTISLPLIKRFDQKDLSILQIDAHADMKGAFDGNKLSHASVMRRVSEFNKNIVQVGVRALDKDEFDYIKENKIKTFFEFDIAKIVKSLKKRVYISIDLDGFDPSVIPDVGTPEPGGLLWDEVLSLLKEVFSKREVVGCDVVELCPSGELSSYTAAKLVYKLVGYYSSPR
ncbi:agmatinase [archaeon]|nr:agmatinase [archaeon]